MLYLLIQELIDIYTFLNVFKYLTVRTGLAVFTSLLVVFLIGTPFINFFSAKKILNPIRKDGPDEHVIKKIDTPTLRALFSVTQRLEGNRKLRAPAELTNMRGNLPGSIPVSVKTRGAKATATTLGDLAVVLTTRWRGAKYEAILLILKTVNDHLKAIEVTEVGITSAVSHDQTARILIKANNRDIEGVVGIAHTHLGFCGGGRAFIRLNLLKVRCWHQALPNRLRQHNAIEHWRFCQGLRL